LLGSPLATDQAGAGAIVLVGAAGAPLGEADLTFLNAIAALVARSVERAHAYGLVARSAAHYRALFDQARDALLLIEQESLQIVEANQAAETLSGYSQHELYDMAPANLIRSELFDRRSRLIAQLSADGRPEIDAHL